MKYIVILFLISLSLFGEYDEERKKRPFIIDSIEYGNDKLVQTLIKQNFDINVSDDNGWNPLIWAAYLGKNDIINLLITKNSSSEYINSKSKSNFTPLMAAVCCEKNSKETVELLLNKNANLDLKDDLGMSALIYAVSCNNSEVVDFLIKKGASINIKDNNGNNALMFYLDNLKDNNLTEINIKIIKALLKTTIKLNTKNKENKTALEIAAEKNIDLNNLDKPKEDLKEEVKDIQKEIKDENNKINEELQKDSKELKKESEELKQEAKNIKEEIQKE